MPGRAASPTVRQSLRAPRYGDPWWLIRDLRISTIFLTALALITIWAVAYADRAQCLIDCARVNGPSGPAYAACIAKCPNVEVLYVLSMIADDGGVDGPPSPVLLKAALRAADDIEDLRRTSGDLRSIINSLRTFFVADWRDEGQRLLFVDTYFVAAMADIVRTQHASPDGIELLRMLMLELSEDEVLAQVSNVGRVGVLALLEQVGSDRESEQVAHAADRWGVQYETLLLTLLFKTEDNYVPKSGTTRREDP